MVLMALKEYFFKILTKLFRFPYLKDKPCPKLDSETQFIFTMEPQNILQLEQLGFKIEILSPQRNIYFATVPDSWKILVGTIFDKDIPKFLLVFPNLSLDPFYGCRIPTIAPYFRVPKIDADRQFLFTSLEDIVQELKNLFFEIELVFPLNNIYFATVPDGWKLLSEKILDNNGKECFSLTYLEENPPLDSIYHVSIPFLTHPPTIKTF